MKYLNLSIVFVTIIGAFWFYLIGDAFFAGKNPLYITMPITFVFIMIGYTFGLKLHLKKHDSIQIYSIKEFAIGIIIQTLIITGLFVVTYSKIAQIESSFLNTIVFIGLLATSTWHLKTQTKFN